MMTRVGSALVAALACACGDGASASDAMTGGAIDARAIDAGPIDAGDVYPFDRTCYDDVPPAVIDAVVTIDAHAFVLDGAPLAGVTVEARRASDATVLGSEVTNAAGDVSFTIDTGGVQPAPGDLTVHLSKAGFSDAVHVIQSLPGDRFATRLALYEPGDWDVIYGMAGETYDPARGLVFVFIDDCFAQTRVPGVSATFSPAAGAVGYLDSTVQPPRIDPSWTATTASGNIYGLNVPAGPSTITLSHDGEVFRTFTVDVAAGTRTAVSARP